MKGGDTSASTESVASALRPAITKRVVNTASGMPSSIAPIMPPVPTIRLLTSAVRYAGCPSIWAKLAKVQAPERLSITLAVKML